MKKKSLVSTILSVILFLAAALYYNFAPEETASTFQADGEFYVHYLDVGQGDSTLLLSGGMSMLIDAGERVASPYIIEYLEGLGINKLDYVIASHPHSDHIGGIADVLKAIPTDTILMPDVTHTTKTFEYLVDTIEEYNVNLTVPNVGDTLPLGDATLTFLSPENKEYDNLNNYSIVVKADYGNTSFLFMADAEKVIENKLLEDSNNLSSTVLKLGHHGSSTSSTYNFLEAVSPDYAIISCGYENDYGHPHKEVVERLDDLGIMSMRTYENGAITAISDGESVRFE